MRIRVTPVFWKTEVEDPIVFAYCIRGELDQECVRAHCIRSQSKRRIFEMQAIDEYYIGSSQVFGVRGFGFKGMTVNAFGNQPVQLDTNTANVEGDIGERRNSCHYSDRFCISSQRR